MEKYDQSWFDEFCNEVDEFLNLNRRETTTVEFKEIFDWNNKDLKSKVSRTAASFANNKGGIIIFGIKNRPNKLVGISDFENTDNYMISTAFNELFTPYINFDTITFKYKKIDFGALIIYESESKPVICQKDSSNTISGEIYFRYNAKTEKIRSGDLINLISQIRQNESAKWLKLFQNASNIGINNVAVLDVVSGEISSKNNTFLLDENLLNQIKILDKYSKSEVGAPAVKIIGEIPGLSKVITRNKTLYEEDLLRGFIFGINITESNEYLKAICHTSHKMPVYYIFRMNGFDRQYSVNLLKGFKVKADIHTKLIKRISQQNDDTALKICRFKLTETKQGIRRKEFLNYIHKSIQIELDSMENVKILLEAITLIDSSIVKYDTLLSYFRKIMLDYYPFKENKTIGYLFRDVVAYIDFVYNKFDLSN